MNILLVRPDGIGDEILCLPVATRLKQIVPQARIGFLSSRYAAPVLANHPDVDVVHILTGGERFGEVVSLFRGGWEAAVFLKPYRRLLAAAFVARVPRRVATGYRWYSLLANRRVYEHRHDFSKHEAEYNLGLLRGLGLDPGPVRAPHLVLTEAEKDEGRRRVDGLPRPRVVIHPGGLTPRHWKMSHYEELVGELLRKGYGVILTGNENERESFGRGMAWSQSHPAVLNVLGQLDLRQLMSLIAACQVLVSASTGPAHIAAALGVSTVTLFDPRRNMSPIRWHPLGENAVLRPDVPTCERCIYEACPYWDCLDRITVADVVARVREIHEFRSVPTGSYA